MSALFPEKFIFRDEGDFLDENRTRTRHAHDNGRGDAAAAAADDDDDDDDDADDDHSEGDGEGEDEDGNNVEAEHENVNGSENESGSDDSEEDEEEDEDDNMTGGHIGKEIIPSSEDEKDDANNDEGGSAGGDIESKDKGNADDRRAAAAAARPAQILLADEDEGDGGKSTKKPKGKRRRKVARPFPKGLCEPVENTMAPKKLKQFMETKKSVCTGKGTKLTCTIEEKDLDNYYTNNPYTNHPWVFFVQWYIRMGYTKKPKGCSKEISNLYENVITDLLKKQKFRLSNYSLILKPSKDKTYTNHVVCFYYYTIQNQEDPLRVEFKIYDDNPHIRKQAMDQLKAAVQMCEMSVRTSHNKCYSDFKIDDTDKELWTLDGNYIISPIESKEQLARYPGNFINENYSIHPWASFIQWFLGQQYNVFPLDAKKYDPLKNLYKIQMIYAHDYDVYFESSCIDKNEFYRVEIFNRDKNDSIDPKTKQIFNIYQDINEVSKLRNAVTKLEVEWRNKWQLENREEDLVEMGNVTRKVKEGGEGNMLNEWLDERQDELNESGYIVTSLETEDQLAHYSFYNNNSDEGDKKPNLWAIFVQWFISMQYYIPVDKRHKKKENPLACLFSDQILNGGDYIIQYNHPRSDNAYIEFVQCQKAIKFFYIYGKQNDKKIKPFDQLKKLQKLVMETEQKGRPVQIIKPAPRSSIEDAPAAASSSGDGGASSSGAGSSKGKKRDAAGKAVASRISENGNDVHDSDSRKRNKTDNGGNKCERGRVSEGGSSGGSKRSDTASLIQQQLKHKRTESIKVKDQISQLEDDMLYIEKTNERERMQKKFDAAKEKDLLIEQDIIALSARLAEMTGGS